MITGASTATAGPQNVDPISARDGAPGHRADPDADEPSSAGPSFSLRTVLALSFGAFGFFSTLIVAFLVHGEASRRLEAEIGRQLKELTVHLAGSLDQGMFERWRDIQIAASDATLREASRSPSEKRAVLKRLQETYPDYAILLLADPNGRIAVTSNGLIEGADISRRDYFLAGRERPFAGDVHDAILLAKALRLDGAEPLRLVDFSAPVRNEDGTLIGVLASHLDWVWARRTAANFETRLQGDRAGAEFLVLAQDGTVLIGPPALLKQRVPATLFTDGQPIANGQASVVSGFPDVRTAYLVARQATHGYRDFPGLGWTVVARQRTDRALSSVSDLSWYVVTIGGLVSASAALFAWAAANRIARPLRDLARMASALGRNEPSLQSPQTRITETRTIARALNAAEAELRSRENSRRLLIDELNHRVRNTLATVQSIASQSFRGLGTEAATGRARFEPRLFALSAAHNVLTRENWSGAELGAIVAEIIRPYESAGSSRFTLDGGPVRLPSNLALSLSMILHELCTNAAKFGALSTDCGSVLLTWRLVPQGRHEHLRLVWRETGGPAVVPPRHHGFGTRLIERGLDAEREGRARIAFLPSGVVCEIDATYRSAGAIEELPRKAARSA